MGLETLVSGAAAQRGAEIGQGPGVLQPGRPEFFGTQMAGVGAAARPGRGPGNRRRAVRPAPAGSRELRRLAAARIPLVICLETGA